MGTYENDSVVYLWSGGDPIKTAADLRTQKGHDSYLNKKTGSWQLKLHFAGTEDQPDFDIRQECINAFESRCRTDGINYQQLIEENIQKDIKRNKQMNAFAVGAGKHVNHRIATGVSTAAGLGFGKRRLVEAEARFGC